MITQRVEEERRAGGRREDPQRRGEPPGERALRGGRVVPERLPAASE